jgi:penicillin-binding protein 2
VATRSERGNILRLPSRRPLVEPISTAQAGFFGSGGFFVRVGLLGALATLLFGILALRLWSLQVIRGPEFRHMAQAQTYRYVNLPTTRAAILDAQGRVLASSSGRVVLTADPEALGTIDSHGRWTPSPHGVAVLERAARAASTLATPLVRRIQREVLRNPYAPAVVLPDLDSDLSYFFDERGKALPGLHVAVLPSRNYPQGALGGEYLGLLGEIGPAQLKERRYRRYQPGEVIGQSGVEASYDRVLNGGLDRARVAVDSVGRTVGPLQVIHRKQPTRILQLSIDARIQRAAEQAIKNGIGYAHAAGHSSAHAGAAVVMDPRTGAVIALASYPDFNQVAAAKDPSYLERLLHSGGPNTPLIDRATQGLYPTGSAFKPIVAEAGLATGTITPYTSLLCSGSFTIGGFTFHNVEPSVYAYMSLPTALSQSCDTWFYRLGDQLYFHRGTPIQDWAHRLGLGRKTGIDLPGEYGGVVPTPQWLEKTRHEQWYEGQTINLSIGQGMLAVTPLQLAVAYSALANGGTVWRPHLAKAILAPDGRVLDELKFKPRRRVRLTDVWAIRDGLFSAAHSGTSATIFGNFPVPVAGKTGTAQTCNGCDDHSWYASWAPASNPRYVVVVVIEHGGFGVEAAAPAARDIYTALFRLGARKKRG